MFALGCACSGADEGPFSIDGAARLPDCSAPPAFDLTGQWSMSGDVTITSAGCFDTAVDESLASCPLTWQLEQTGADLSIVVDNEYLMRGRVCGTDVFFEGGFWLPVRDGNDCTYEEDSAAEVGIDAGSLALDDTGDEMTGTLAIRADCTADYAMTLFRF